MVTYILTNRSSSSINRQVKTSYRSYFVGPSGYPCSVDTVGGTGTSPPAPHPPPVFLSHDGRRRGSIRSGSRGLREVPRSESPRRVGRRLRVGNGTTVDTGPGNNDRPPFGVTLGPSRETPLVTRSWSWTDMSSPGVTEDVFAPGSRCL